MVGCGTLVFAFSCTPRSQFQATKLTVASNITPIISSAPNQGQRRKGLLERSFSVSRKTFWADVIFLISTCGAVATGFFVIVSPLLHLIAHVFALLIVAVWQINSYPFYHPCPIILIRLTGISANTR